MPVLSTARRRIITCTWVRWPCWTPPPRRGASMWSSLRALVESRSGLLGPFLRRLVEVPFGLDRPAWVDDQHLDLVHQIRPVGVPAPGGPASSVRWLVICWPTSSNRAAPYGRSGSSRVWNTVGWLSSPRCITAWRTESGALACTRCSTISNLAHPSKGPIHQCFRVSASPLLGRWVCGPSPGWQPSH